MHAHGMQHQLELLYECKQDSTFVLVKINVCDGSASKMMEQCRPKIRKEDRGKGCSEPKEKEWLEEEKYCLKELFNLLWEGSEHVRDTSLTQRARYQLIQVFPILAQFSLNECDNLVSAVGCMCVSALKVEFKHKESK